ncbi:hypothetical protein [Enterococcus wangshanyuanii]|uniref:Uncharacterized protein n=1 Tax=Enterococcus wangshanyuanii TaxID=2005703 RepID=A0ABQ1PSW6_9ENTE|nr:hypothetical protein [Enterococcus wangshanyuanii]GGD02829.1 hypothetical protein GCM10011573_35400 [Enterococcus wangshanyuanii]
MKYEIVLETNQGVSKTVLPNKETAKLIFADRCNELGIDESNVIESNGDFEGGYIIFRKNGERQTISFSPKKDQ